MKALQLRKQRDITLCDVPAPVAPGYGEVSIRIHTVGICGSDVHYYRHGRIGPFVVAKPMILGHEAAGTISAVGPGVNHLQVGDRVCMEPGIPDSQSPQTLAGRYNVDPAVRFWATPPIDGCLCEEVTHPAAFTFKLPDNVSFAEGAMVEPLAIGMHATVLAGVRTGDVALVTGAGTIGLLTALSALAAGCSQVIISDPVAEKRQLADLYHSEGLVSVNALDRPAMMETISQLTQGQGVDVVFECSGARRAISTATDFVAPGGTVVWIGMPTEPMAIDIVAAQAKELTFKSLFRYVNQFPRTLKLIAAGKFRLQPLISATYTFAQAVEAFERADEAQAGDVKIMITLV